MIARWKSLPMAQRWMLAVLAFVVAIAQIDQPYPAVAPLHHTPTVLLLLASPYLLTRWPLSNAAVGCIVAFFLLHTLAGRYTYTMTPYDDWAAAITGHSINTLFGWERNNFDRLVHFTFGLTAILPAYEILTKYLGVGHRFAIYIGLEFVMGISAVYELFEWGLAEVIAGDAAAQYNGQQGDVWDAQKDMALALLGALFTSGILICQKYRGMLDRV